MKNIKDITKEDLIELHLNQLKTQTEIGKMFNCTRKNVAYYLKKFDIKPLTQSEIMTRKYDKNIDIEKVKSMIESGMLVEDVMEHFNISRSALFKHTRKAGLNFRNHKAQTKKQSERMKSDNPIPKGTIRDKKHIQPMIDKNMELAKERRKNIKTFKQYQKIARSVAYINYGRKTPEGLNIDHIFSIRDGWENGIEIDDISHPNNLRLISESENRIKGPKSIITIEQFYRLIGKPIE